MNLPTSFGYKTSHPSELDQNIVDYLDGITTSLPECPRCSGPSARQALDFNDESRYRG